MRTFEVTPGQHHVSLSSGSHAAVLFTVTNRSEHPLHGRAVVRAGEAMQAEWLRVEPERLRFDAGGTEQVCLHVEAPEGMTEARHQARLLVANEAKPEDDWTESAPVAIQVSSPPEKRDKSWLWVILVAAGLVLAALGFVLWRYLTSDDTGGDPTPDPEEPAPEPDGPQAAARLRSTTTPASIDHSWHTLRISSLTMREPVFLAAMQTTHGTDPASVRIRRVSRQRKRGATAHQLVAELRIEEDQTGPHLNAEVVGAIAAPDALLQDRSGELIGEAGSLQQSQTRPDQVHRLRFERRYDNPVVLMQVVSTNGSDPVHVRLRGVDSDGADYSLEEWSHLDGKHTREELHFLVLEQGRHIVYDRQSEAPVRAVVEAGQVQAEENWVPVPLGSAFAGPPVVLSQSQTRRGADPVVTRQRQVERDGFEVRLQEDKANDDNHTVETVGYVAVSTTPVRVRDHR